MKRNKIKPMKTKHQTCQDWIAACLDCMFRLPRSCTGHKLQRDNTYLKRDFAQLRSIVQAQPDISLNWNAQWTAAFHLPDISASVTTVLTVLWGIPDCLVSNVNNCWIPVLYIWVTCLRHMAYPLCRLPGGQGTVRGAEPTLCPPCLTHWQ